MRGETGEERLCALTSKQSICNKLRRRQRLKTELAALKKNPNGSEAAATATGTPTPSSGGGAFGGATTTTPSSGGSTGKQK